MRRQRGVLAQVLWLAPAPKGLEGERHGVKRQRGDLPQELWSAPAPKVSKDKSAERLEVGAQTVRHCLSLVVADVDWDALMLLEHVGGNLAVPPVGAAGAIWVELSQDLVLLGTGLVVFRA